MVDVIIPSYNRKRKLREAIHSLQRQTFKRFRLYVVDDGSLDGTEEHLRRSMRRGDFEFCPLGRNFGVSRARNEGVRRGLRPWIAFLDSDDLWAPDKLLRQIEYIEKNPGIEFIHTNEVWMDRGRILRQRLRHKKQGGRIFIPSVRLCCVSPSSVLIKRSLFESEGMFREDFPLCEDYELWLRITAKKRAGFVDAPLIIKRAGHPGQLSRAAKAMDYWRVKALRPFLQSALLTAEERGAVRSALIQKCQILLKGALKYGHARILREIPSVLHEALYLQAAKL